MAGRRTKISSRLQLICIKWILIWLLLPNSKPNTCQCYHEIRFWPLELSPAVICCLQCRSVWLWNNIKFCWDPHLQYLSKVLKKTSTVYPFTQLSWVFSREGLCSFICSFCATLWKFKCLVGASMCVLSWNRLRSLREQSLKLY